MPSQDDLRSVWLQAPEGKLCGREKAKAWALREVWRGEGKAEYGMYKFIAEKVKTIHNGKPQGPSPHPVSIAEFLLLALRRQADGRLARCATPCCRRSADPLGFRMD